MDSSSAIASALSFYVSDENGNFIYEYQGNKGLSTASTQKIFPAGAALETLGKIILSKQLPAIQEVCLVGL